LSSFSKDPSTVILTETTANLQADNFIPCIDRTLERIIGEPQMIPEIVVTIGGPIISKKIKSLFRKYNPSEHWHIEPTEATMDVFTSLTKIIPVDPAYFFNTLKDKTQIIQSSFQKIWMDQYHQSKKNHDDFIESIEWSDLKAHQLIHEHIPEKVNFQMGNSTAVRYVQLFEYNKDIQFNGNRGVSGIDGSTSTAMGAALVNDKLTLLVTGDLSFVYDINAFWNKTHPDNLKIIVVNNNGGGIFKIIPGPFSTPYGKEHFEAENPANLKHLAQAHNIEFLSANDIETTNKALKDLFNSRSTCILELETHHCNNEDVLKSYFEAIKN
jgi:2-succinyl-5-enolpyruvyl-6-hydroxy-3-cyclohexene-1-carboxylate synthase